MSQSEKHSSMLAFPILLLAIAFVFICAGVYLIYLGGSFYYLLAGVILIASAVQLRKGKRLGSWLYGGLILLSLLWGVWEVGLDLWALLPRVATFSVIGLWLLTPSVRRKLHAPNPAPPILTSTGTWAVAGIFVVVIAGGIIKANDYQLSSISPTPSTATVVNERTDWPSYGNTDGGTRYSPIEQINTENVSNLEVAWTYRTKVGGVFKATPTQVGDKLFMCGGGNIVIALDAESGELRWQYDPKISPDQLLAVRYFTTTCRGVSYFEAPDDYSGECPTRILTATTDARLIAVDADTGALCTSFGSNGEVDLSKNMGTKPPIYYFVTSPPAIVQGNAVVGGWVLDNREVKEPSGVVRAFDALTGKFSWAWDMGRPGINTEPQNGETYTNGTPNVWTLFSVDKERGIVYAPTGNETPDYFGGLRLDVSEKYASSVVALDGNNGSVLWSFQTVHHDIWDYDVPSQPVLIDLPEDDGSVTPALIQATKRGEIFLLNRVTGEPIAEVEERAVPQDGGVPEDWLAPTQPFSVGMPHFRDDLTEADMWGVTPFDQLWCRIAFRQARYDGHFTPTGTELSIQFPGNAGGFNWGSVSVDEENKLLVASPMIMANRVRLIPRAEMDAGARGSAQLGTPYGATTSQFMSPLQVPCAKPPYGVMAVIDLKTRKTVWKRPLGTANDSGPLGIKSGLPITVGTPISAGTMVTKGGLIFIGGTLDRRLRAIDINSGKELWKTKLPTTAQATPMSYLSPESKQQTIVITTPVYGRSSAGGPSTLLPEDEDPEGGYVIAYRLKQQ